MTAPEDDPFTLFAKQLETTGEVVKDIASSVPSLPTKATPLKELIEGYVLFERYAKERKAAESAYMKAHREQYNALINQAISDYIGEGNDGVLIGDENALLIERTYKPVFDQVALRKIDMETTGASEDTPVAGLKITYGGDPDAASDIDIATRIRDAIQEYKAGRKITMISADEARRRSPSAVSSGCWGATK